MLTIDTIRGSPEEFAARLFRKDNYFSIRPLEGDPQSPDGLAAGHIRVHGRLAGRFGFAEGPCITREQVTDLLSGKSIPAAERGRARQVIATAFNFLAPKSVSVAALVTENDARLIRAHDESVLEVMRGVARDDAKVNVRVDGKASLTKTGNLLFVTVREGFDLRMNPDLKTHVIVMNMTEYEGMLRPVSFWRPAWEPGMVKPLGAQYRMLMLRKVQEWYGRELLAFENWRIGRVAGNEEREFSSPKDMGPLEGERFFDWDWSRFRLRDGAEDAAASSAAVEKWGERLAEVRQAVGSGER